MKRKTKIILLLSVIITIVGYFISIWENLRFKTSDSIDEVPRVYIEPLNLNANPIRFCKTTFRNTRLPISELSFNKVATTIYSLNTFSDEKLPDFTKINYNLTDLGLNATTYNGLDHYIRFDYDIMHKHNSINGIEIHFLKEEKIKQFIKKDSILAYFIPNNRGLNIRYKDCDYNDVAIKANDNIWLPTTNLIIVFRKVNRQVVVYILCRKNERMPEILEDDYYKIFK